MGLETTASLSTIAGLKIAWPIHDEDPFSECDNQIANLKLATFRTFPNVGSEVSANATELNYLQGQGSVTGVVSQQVGGVLYDNDADFITNKVQVGDVIHTNTGISATIGTIASANILSNIVGSPIFSLSAEYYIDVKNNKAVTAAVQTQLDNKLSATDTAYAAIEILSSKRYIKSTTPALAASGDFWFKIGDEV